MFTALDLDFSKIESYIPFMLKGTLFTLQFTFFSLLVGLILGLILTLFKISTIKPLKWFAVAYTSVFRGTPLLLQLTLVYFATPQLIGIEISALAAGVITFGMNSAAYVSETMRGGILAVDKGQDEAAMSLGVPYATRMRHIILPQAFRNILPSLVNEVIALLKDSTLVSVIGVMDLLWRAKTVGNKIFVYFEPLLFAGLVYYLLVMALTILANLLERRLRRGD
ncbi:arginine ABC transporter permease [Paenibacillus swuensis]|uniref:Arginine ABC transporter permease n=1 Tax=Paenibacillus swuensis TaxID=1178515 RepID=A0A172THV4_9BACL|nr:amino acid ABC transporter permease [Paenibacillus swuensis]ANE46645.1 arginine ABC transporter permease [Paenibacillus swuensis]